MSHSSTKSRAYILVACALLLHCAGEPQTPEADSAEGALNRLPPKARERVSELRAELAKDPASPGRWLDLAMTLHANAESAAAVEAYAEVLNHQSDNAVAMYLRSHALRASGEFEAAVEQLTACLDSGAPYPPASRVAALWALDDGDLARARSVANDALQRWPDALGLRATKVRIDMASGDYAAAKEAVLGVAETAEESGYLAYLAARLQQAESGEGASLQPVAEPRWTDPWLEGLGRFRGGTEESLKEAQAAIAAGQSQTAIDLLEPVRRWEPNDPRVAQVLAVAYRETQNFPKAIQLLETSMENQPGVLETHIQLVTTRFVYALGSRDPSALEEAAVEANRLREVWPEDWRSNALAGDVLYSVGKHEEALVSYLECGSLQPQSPAQCEFKAARALVQLGRQGEAQKLLTDTFGEAPEAEDVARLLAAAKRLPSDNG